MDELWQRYRLFWTPVLIGFGAFLVGLIAVHVASDDPKVARGGVTRATSKVKNMKQPDARKATVLKARGESLREQARDWAKRVDQASGQAGEETTAAAEQALRAAILRGASEQEASNPQLLRARFDDDAVAADKAYKRFVHLAETHATALRSGDPNVAGMQLLSDVWNELRVRANRANVEVGPAAVQLGFGSIGSVSRATLTARVLNLALVARIVDIAIRNDVKRIDQVSIPNQVDPGDPLEFLLLWPVEVVLIADMAAVKDVIKGVTDPAHPVPLEGARLLQPRKGVGAGQRGLVQFSIKASSAIVRPDVSLNLDQEEDQ